VGFEPTIPVFERAKPFHALDLAATAIGSYCIGVLKMNISFSFATSVPKHLSVLLESEVDKIFSGCQPRQLVQK
jgi:hypothetical protein